jgi:hypothetical protein
VRWHFVHDLVDGGIAAGGVPERDEEIARYGTNRSPSA